MNLPAQVSESANNSMCNTKKKSFPWNGLSMLGEIYK